MHYRVVDTRCLDLGGVVVRRSVLVPGENVSPFFIPAGIKQQAPACLSLPKEDYRGIAVTLEWAKTMGAH